MANSGNPPSEQSSWQPGLRSASGLKTTLVVVLINVVVAGVVAFVNFAYITGRYSERFDISNRRIGAVEEKVKGMDEKGTQHSSGQLDEIHRDIGRVEARVSAVEAETSHFDVIESEHRRLTKDVEDLKAEHGKK
jgi:hypothetical protein